MELRLIEPGLEWEEAFTEIAREHQSVDSTTLDGSWGLEKGLEDFQGHVRSLIDGAQGKNLPEGWVPYSLYWLLREEDGKIVGQISLRHELSPLLREWGGHIGYYVRPSERKKGHATKMLELVLDKARELGIEKLLVTCGGNNIASEKVIKSNGGIFENEVFVEDEGRIIKRHWIDLKGPGENG